MLILDTDHLSLLQQRSGSASIRLIERLRDYPSSVRFTSIVSFHEQLLGWHAYLQRAAGRSQVVPGYRMFHKILVFFSKLQIAPFDDRAAEVFESFRREGVRVSTLDLRIASTAVALGYKVLTRNTRDFERVPGLQVEDWTLP